MTDKERPTLTIHDNLDKWRCPQLGGPVKFEYCRRMSEGLPCHQLFNCWWEKLDIEEYLQKNFTQDEIDRVFAQPPRGRMGIIFDALTKAEQMKKKQE